MLPICLTLWAPESFSLSVSPLQLFAPSQLLSRQCHHPSFPPPWDDADWDHELHWTELLVGLSWLLFPIWFHKIWWLFWLTQTAQRPLALLAWVSSDIWAWCPSLGALSQNSCCTVLSYTSQGDFSPQDPSTRVAFHLLSALTGTCWVECLRRVTGCLCLQVQAVI